MKFIFFLIILFYSSLSLAQEVSVRSKLDKALATTKDEIRFSVELKMPKSLNLSVPDLEEKIKGLRILKSDKEESIEGEIKLKKYWYQLQADVSGSYILPAVRIAYVDSKSNEQKTVQSAEIFLEVKSQFSEESEHKDIRGLKPLYETPFPFHYLYIILGLMILILGLIYIAKKYKKKEKEKNQEPLDQIYMRRLKNMKLNLETKEELKKTYFELSEILKGIFEYRFSFPASDLTLEEARKKLNSDKKIKEDYKNNFLNLLDQMELVKYANVLGNYTDTEKIHGSILSFLHETSPPKEEEV